VLKALSNLPSNITNATLPLPSGNQSTWDLIPEGQLGVTLSQLPLQAVSVDRNASSTGPESDINKLNGTVVNGGEATEGEGWAAALQRELANRYLTSAFCSWSDCISPIHPSIMMLTTYHALAGTQVEVQLKAFFPGCLMQN